MTTDVMRQRVSKLTAIEIDPELAEKLRKRLEGTNVTVVEADATQLPLEDNRFSTATNFTMLHHVPSPELQDKVLSEMCRVLRPGGMIIGTDVVPSGTLDEPDLGWVRSRFRFYGVKP